MVDLAKYVDTKVRVRFQGGREVEGVFKGYDKMDNLVLATVVLSGISGSSEQNYQTETQTYDQHKQKTLLTLVGIRM